MADAGAQLAATSPRSFRHLLRRYPLTLVLLAVTVLAPAVLHFGFGVREHALLATLSGSAESVFRHGQWFSPISGVFMGGGILAAVLGAAGILILVSYSERVIGSARTLLAYLSTGAIAIVIGLTLERLLYTSGERWGRHVYGTALLEVLVPVVGTIMVASAASGPLWRRRIRVIGFATLLALVLFSGQAGDVHRLIAAVSGLLLGPYIAGRRPQTRFVRSSVHEIRTLVGVIVMIVAVGPVITMLSPHRLGPLSPLGVLFLPQSSPPLAADRLDGPGPLLLSILPLLVLVLAARGLQHGRRAALVIAIGINLLMAGLAAFYYGFLPSAGNDQLLDLSSAGHWEFLVTLAVSTVVPVAVAGMLFVFRANFAVRIEHERALLALWVVLGAGLIGSGIYFAVGLIDPAGFAPPATPAMLVDDLAERFVPVGFLAERSLEFVPVSAAARAAYFWVGPLVWAVLACTTFWVLRSPPREAATGSAQRYRQLRHAGGGGSLGHMGLWPGMLHWTARDGQAAIAYVLVGRFALTVTEPVCSAEQRMSAIREFAEYCDERGRTPVFYAVHGEYLPLFAALGWSSVRVGEEAVLSPASWSLVGKAWQDVRSSIHRAERAGIEAVWTPWSELSLAQRAQIAEISEEWVADRGLPEMGFTLGGLDEMADAETRLLLAVRPDGRVEAVTSWMPSWRPAASAVDLSADPVIDGWTLDVMRRRDGSMNGVMEFLIASMVERAGRQGARFVSLSTAPFAGTGESQGSAAERVRRFVSDALEPVYGFSSLLRFKRKFRPRFEPVSIAFPDPVELPAIASAIVRAYLPGVSLRGGMRMAWDAREHRGAQRTPTA
ncbi:bifunctional lysylphosphatidylglycerol flippase/synthetase MprF [Microterricola viridarii]|uniref:Phosphatidylglycerol lysyltransferase C-terminal domain-containing protein n=1 Tax=Microterricola viridarii TaxID=412690 RepID=A0A0X8E265_9MICO|nr:phosphatidylglycerol lysyltransferase domain-containing protein [Microterricola viridarii]AMB58658.1 hypothetical protein AWU67_07060 [Microterricola viridarii]